MTWILFHHHFYELFLKIHKRDFPAATGATLHALHVAGGYLSSHCPSVAVSNQSVRADLWPLTSSRHFLPQNCCSLDISSFSPSTLKRWGCARVEIPEGQQQWTTKSLSPARPRPPCSKSRQIILLSLSDAGFELQQVDFRQGLPLSCCHVLSYLG